MYQGYLHPWMNHIIKQYQAGMAPRAIADGLRPMLRKAGYRYGEPEMGNVIYALRRSGIAVPAAPLSPKRAASEKARLLRQQQRIAKWCGLQSGPTLIFRTTRGWFLFSNPIAHSPVNGRPLDMGGPRHVWIERSPWDER